MTTDPHTRTVGEVEALRDKFQQGDTVRLKSGGPLMTVERIRTCDNDTLVDCSWFCLDGKHLDGAWPPAMLSLDTGKLIFSESSSSTPSLTPLLLYWSIPPAS